MVPRTISIISPSRHLRRKHRVGLQTTDYRTGAASGITRLSEYINSQKTAAILGLRYAAGMMSPEKDWQEFTEALSRRYLATLMSAAWG